MPKWLRVDQVGLILVSFLNLFDRWNQSSPTLSSHHRRPNSHAQLALGVDLQAAGLAAYREIAWATRRDRASPVRFWRPDAGRCSRICRDRIVRNRDGNRRPTLCRRAPSRPIKCGKLRPRRARGLAHDTARLRGCIDLLGGRAKRAEIQADRRMMRRPRHSNPSSASGVWLNRRTRRMSRRGPRAIHASGLAAAAFGDGHDRPQVMR